MLLVPNHHPVVPITEDMAFKMPNRITGNSGARQANQYSVSVENQKVIPLPFNPQSVYYAEVYINDVRVINTKYPTTHTAGIPHEIYTVTSNSLVFAQPVSGKVTVIADTIGRPLPEFTTDMTKKGLIIDVNNFQSYDMYEQRFIPARWASGRQPSAGPYGVINTQIRNRVAVSQYTEPVVIRRPHNGYVRLTANRKDFLYVPNANFRGYDCFQYTLLTQHGQIGPPKNIFIEVFGPPTGLVHTLRANLSPIIESGFASFVLETENVQPGTQVLFRVIDDPVKNYRLISNFEDGGAFLNDTGEYGVFIVGEDGKSQIVLESFPDDIWSPTTSRVYAILDCDSTANANITINGASAVLTSNVSVIAPGQCVKFTVSTNFPRVIDVNLDFEIGYVDFNVDTNTVIDNSWRTVQTGTFHTKNNTANVQYCTTFVCPSSLYGSANIINGNFEEELSNWSVYRPGIETPFPFRLDGTYNFLGFLTPNITEKPIISSVSPELITDNVTIRSPFFQTIRTETGNNGPSEPGELSLLVRTEVSLEEGYGIVRGPILVTDNTFFLTSGMTVAFDYFISKDQVDVVGFTMYLVNVDNGFTILLRNFFEEFTVVESQAVRKSKTEKWETFSAVLNDAPKGFYKLVVVINAWDGTGGTVAGANLLLDNFRILLVPFCGNIRNHIACRLTVDNSIIAKTRIYNYDFLELEVANNVVVEGSSVTFKLINKNLDTCDVIPDNTRFPYDLYSVSELDASDLRSDTKFSGNFIFRSQQAQNTVYTVSDTISDFGEKFELNVLRCPDLTKTITIIESCPEIELFISSLSVFEGDTVTINYRIRNLSYPNLQRKIYWKQNGNMVSDDFVLPITQLSGEILDINYNSISTNGLTGSLTFVIKIDSGYNPGSFEYFGVKFFTNRATEATCFQSPYIKVYEKQPPPPSATPTPTPSRSSIIRPPITTPPTPTPTPTPGTVICQPLEVNISFLGSCMIADGRTKYRIRAIFSRPLGTFGALRGNGSWGGGDYRISGAFSPSGNPVYHNGIVYHLGGHRIFDLECIVFKSLSNSAAGPVGGPYKISLGGYDPINKNVTGYVWATDNNNCINNISNTIVINVC